MERSGHPYQASPLFSLHDAWHDLDGMVHDAACLSTRACMMGMRCGRGDHKILNLVSGSSTVVARLVSGHLVSTRLSSCGGPRGRGSKHVKWQVPIGSDFHDDFLVG